MPFLSFNQWLKIIFISTVSLSLIFLSTIDVFKVFSYSKVITFIQSPNLVYPFFNCDMYSFLINIAKLVSKAVLDDISIPTLGLIINNVDEVNVEVDSFEFSVMFNEIFFFFEFFFLFKTILINFKRFQNNLMNVFISFFF